MIELLTSPIITHLGEVVVQCLMKPIAARSQPLSFTLESFCYAIIPLQHAHSSQGAV